MTLSNSFQDSTEFMIFVPIWQYSSRNESINDTFELL